MKKQCRIRKNTSLYSILAAVAPPPTPFLCLLFRVTPECPDRQGTGFQRKTLSFLAFPASKNPPVLKLTSFIMAEVFYGNAFPKEAAAAGENCQDTARGLWTFLGFFKFFFNKSSKFY